METGDIGACTKCKSEIPLEADRCPECGYEPRIGILGGIGMWVSLMLGSTFAVIALSSLIVIADGFPVRDGLLVAGITGGIALFFLAFVHKKWQDHRSKPAQPVGRTAENNTDSESKSFRDSWEEGKERGENWKDRIDHAPDWMFNAAIITGVMISLSVWVVGALELETAMIVSLIAGLAVLGLGVTIDVERTNRVYGTGFRWWFWGVLAMIPLIGWIPALAWMIRRRRSLPTDTESRNTVAS